MIYELFGFGNIKKKEKDTKELGGKLQNMSTEGQIAKGQICTACDSWKSLACTFVFFFLLKPVLQR